MHHREVEATREFVVRLETGRDWRGEVERLADEEDLDAAWFVGMGAVMDAEVWFYDQDEGEYRSVDFDEPLEVAACVGNVARLDGDRFAHTHAVLSRASGQALAGHLDAGTVFAGELYVRAFEAPLERAHDATTDLDLWLNDAGGDGGDGEDAGESADAADEGA
jgi:predicted DNA-binding protein with PD1-like motif